MSCIRMNLALSNHCCLFACNFYITSANCKPLPFAVEDLPVKGDTGFRMAVDYRYRILDDLDVNARLGMGARTTEAVGANLGLGFILHF